MANTYLEYYNEEFEDEIKSNPNFLTEQIAEYVKLWDKDTTTNKISTIKFICQTMWGGSGRSWIDWIRY